MVSNEIPFARAQYQLLAAKTPCNSDFFGIKKTAFFLQFADSMLNIQTPSQISERFFKQVSFHTKFTLAPYKTNIKLSSLIQALKVFL
jgi:hypothetical protein